MFSTKTFRWSCIALLHSLLISGNAIAQTEAQWIEDPRNGCKVFNNRPETSETITYDGECKNGYADGEGTVVWFKDQIFIQKGEGSWKKGKMNGKGTYEWSNGDRYLGDFVESRRTGKGVYIRPTGEKYVGDFVNGKFNWFDGTYYSANGKEPFTEGYSARIRAKIKQNITFNPINANGNPTVELEVNIDLSGLIINRKILKSSGDLNWNNAVLKAIDKTVQIPKDVDGRVFSPLIITFKLLD